MADLRHRGPDLWNRNGRSLRCIESGVIKLRSVSDAHRTWCPDSGVQDPGMNGHDRLKAMELVAAGCCEMALLVGVVRLIQGRLIWTVATLSASLLAGVCTYWLSMASETHARPTMLPDVPRRSAIQFGAVSGSLLYALGVWYLLWGLTGRSVRLVIAIGPCLFFFTLGNFFLLGLVRVLTGRVGASHGGEESGDGPAAT